jgi:cytolethal distending toxin subunit B
MGEAGMEKISFRKPAPGWQAVARVIAVVVLAASGLTAAGTPAHAANLEQHNPATYNMQGASADTTPKWSSDIPSLLNHDVIALQEAGPLPPLDPNGVFSYQDTHTSPSGLRVYHYIRNFGTRSRPNFRHVYFMQTDPNGNRVNLAMVTQQAADQLWFVPSTFAGSRASFGVRLGNTVFYTVHGLSGSGNDIPNMVNRIANGMQNAGFDYAIMGDFNRDPSSLIGGPLVPGAHIYRSGQATQQSSGELDYMVASRDMGALGLLYQGHRLGGFSSDHYPVEFGVVPLRAAAGYSIGSYSNHGNQERIVDVYNGNTANGTHIITYDPNSGGNQKFTFVPTSGGYNIKNLSTGKCLDLNRGTGARNGDYVNEWDCLGQSTQRWSVFPWPGDPGAVGIYNVWTHDCLDVFRNGTGNGVWADIWPCKQSDNENQKWTLQYLGYSLQTR